MPGSVRPRLVAALLAAVAACGAPAERRGSRDTSSLVGAIAPRPTGRPAVPDSTLLARFQAFLDSSVVTRLDSSESFVGRPERCEDDEIVPPVDYLLAAGRALAVTPRAADAVTVRAALTIVAEDSVSDVGGGHRVVRLGVRTDTVTWDMVGDSTGAWHPCGYASSSRDLGPMGDRGLPTSWQPAGAGWRDVARLTDSVRRARGLAP